MRVEADKAEAELAALLSEKLASQPTTTDISTSAVMSSMHIDDNITAVDDGIVMGPLTTPAIAPTPTTIAPEQGFEANKRERQFASPGAVPVSAMRQSFVPSSSSQTGIPQLHPIPSSATSPSQGLLEENQQSQTQSKTPPSPSSLPPSDGAASALTSLRKEAEELRMAELAVLAERNLVRRTFRTLLNETLIRSLTLLRFQPCHTSHSHLF